MHGRVRVQRHGLQFHVCGFPDALPKCLLNLENLPRYVQLQTRHLLAVFFDGKYVEIKDGDHLRPACIYLVVGLGRDGKKRVLSCIIKLGRENLEDWKTVLRGLIERGLRRVLIIIQDDFSGLLPITKSLFPQADVQLCVVHMQRNAKNHLSKTDAAEFQQRWRAIWTGSPVHSSAAVPRVSAVRT